MRIGINLPVMVPGLDRALVRAWCEAGRERAPKLVSGCWFALGPEGPARMDAQLRRYLNFFGHALDYLIPMVPTVSATARREAVAGARDAGTDELVPAPTTSDPDEVKRVCDLLF